MPDATKRPTVLYHYCSNEAFVSIVKSKQIWLSLLSLSNDSMEGKWIKKFVEDACKIERISRHTTQSVMEHLADYIEIGEALGFCMSADGDVLSQWRAYASDGGGVSIGFDQSALVSLNLPEQREIGFDLAEVIYDEDIQKSRVAPILKRILADVKTGILKEPWQPTGADYFKKLNEWRGQFTDLFEHLYTLKNPAFKEERESRLIAILPTEHYEANEITVTCSYRAVGRNKIVPYWPLDLSKAEGNPIVEVVLGPKNETPIKFVMSLLEREGFPRVMVETSKASYR